MSASVDENMQVIPQDAGDSQSPDIPTPLNYQLPQANARHEVPASPSVAGEPGANGHLGHLPASAPSFNAITTPQRITLVSQELPALDSPISLHSPQSGYATHGYLTPQRHVISANLRSPANALDSSSTGQGTPQQQQNSLSSQHLAYASTLSSQQYHTDFIESGDSEMMADDMDPEPIRQKSIRVQFLTTKQSLRTASGHCEQVRVVGSLPQLTDWGVGCNMEDRNGAWTYDMLLTGVYTPETVIEFLYKYTAHNARGAIIWESRVSRCRLQLDKLLDHVFNGAHHSHGKTKIVFQANGIPPCDDTMDLIIAGSLPALGNWDMKEARGLRKASAGGTHHTTVFVEEGTRFNYAYFLVRRMGSLFHGLPGSFVAPQVEAPMGDNAAILWGSGVGTLTASTNELACVQLLDEWEHHAESANGAYFGSINQAHNAATSQLVGNFKIEMPTNPNPKPLKASTAEELMDLQQKLNERLQCKVCWEQDVAMVFLPCGHMCACDSCGHKMAKCALCRAMIEKRIKTYI